MLKICVGTGHAPLGRFDQQNIAHGVNSVNFELEASISARTVEVR